MIRVFTTRNSKSAVKLGFPTYINPSDIAEDFKPSDDLIRWGCSTPLDNEASDAINSIGSLRANVNKKHSIVLMREAVDTPTLYESAVPRGVKAVVRSNAHQRGDGFMIKEGPFTIDPRKEYATKFIEGTEYRAWFFGQMPCLIAKRIRVRPDDSEQCKSEWDYDFRVSEATPSSVVKDAADTIGLFFGAADIIVKDGASYFLELNSAPALDHSKIVTFFREGIREYYAD